MRRPIRSTRTKVLLVVVVSLMSAVVICGLALVMTVVFRSAPVGMGERFCQLDDRVYLRIADANDEWIDYYLSEEAQDSRLALTFTVPGDEREYAVLPEFDTDGERLLRLYITTSAVIPSLETGQTGYVYTLDGDVPDDAWTADYLLDAMSEGIYCYVAR